MKKVVGTKAGNAATRAVIDPAWGGNARDGCVVITPAVDSVKGKEKAKKEWASERTARAVFGGRDPKEAKSAEAIWSRLRRLISDIAPGYDHKLFKGCHQANDLLDRYARNVDLCIVAALQRYCMVAPEEDYPCIIRDWPWSHERMSRWVADHRTGTEKASARAEAAGAEKASARAEAAAEPVRTSSSASSSAPPRAGWIGPRLRHELGKEEDRPGKRTRRELGERVGSPPPTAPEHAPGSLYSKWAEGL